MRIGYFINQYPKVSHTFIRREIEALERADVEVKRYALRALGDELVDEQDRAELRRTRVVVAVGGAVALRAVGMALVKRPRGFVAALALAKRLAGSSPAAWLKNGVCFVEACVLWQWLLEDKVEHLHAHFGTNSASVAMLAAEIGALRYSLTVHGPEEFDMPLAIGLPAKIERAAFVVAISSFCRSQLFRWVDPAHWSKIHIVHCALAGHQFDSPGTPIATSAPARFVSVGRLSAEKGQVLMLQAVAALRQRGVTVHLQLAGDGPLRQALQALIDELDLKAQVSITGWIDNAQVRALLLQSRALVQASFAEGLPVVIMEAFAARRPVIATYLAGIPELVQSGKNGWLTPAGDLQAFCDALQEAAQASPQRLAEMGEHGHALALRYHHADTEAARLKQLFADALPAGAEVAAFVRPPQQALP
jgi:colanic acid/amylovoran biosynthesis glycosyltransferase